MPRYHQKPDLRSDLRDVRQQVASQGTAARNQATSITSGATTVRADDGTTPVLKFGVLDVESRGMSVSPGGVFRLAGGVFVQYDDTGAVPVVYAGPADIPDGSGRTNRVFVLRRDDDGSVALALGDFGANPGHDHHQALTWSDRGGNIVFADDTTSGSGLAKPHLPIPTGCGDTDIARWPHSASTSWTTVWSQYVERQNPRLRWSAYLYAPAGVVAEWALSYGGSQVGTTQSLAGGAAGMFAIWTDVASVVDLVDYNATAPLQVQSRVVSGAGDAKFSWLHLIGDQT